MTKFSIGIDLGGSHITAAIVDQNGRIRTKKKVSFSKAPNGKAGIRFIAQLVNQIIRHSSFVIRHSVIGLGIACPGGVDSERGIVLADSPNLIGWKGTRVKKQLERTLGIPVFIDNDANLAAWGERCWGAGRGLPAPSGARQAGARNLICLTLGTGVGGGIIIDNRIYRGSHFYAAEIGHMTVDPDGPPCSCGKAGHLESFASAPAIVRSYTTICNPQSKIRNPSAKSVFDMARKGDKLASKVIQQTAHYLGIAIGSLIDIFDPEMVVIGGGVAQAGDILFRPLRQVVKASIMKHPYRRPKIVPAKLGEDAGLLGAAALALHPHL